MMSDPAPEGAAGAAIAHGGNLTAARRLFPGAPEPLIDLSTGINPHAYPIPPIPPEAFTRLPEPAAVAALEAAAAARYGAPSPAHVVAAPGTQILLPLIAGLVPPGPARVLGPTYAEHARAARLAGHDCREVGSLAELTGARFAVVVNPNNPDGRVVPRADLAEVARRVAADGGLFVVDEAFGEVAPPALSLAPDTAQPGLLVLRSFGKFHGLAGVRLGFAVASPATAGWLRSRLGPWAISGPAVAIGAAALADRAWADTTRDRLTAESARLDRLLRAAGIAVCGGTPLFRLVRAPETFFQRMGQAGILVRAFTERPGLFRLGLPPDEPAWTRLAAALAAA